MSEYDTDEVTRALLAKLYEQITAQPDAGPEAMPEDRFIAWCVPGIPFQKEDFEFALRGIGGSMADTGPSEDENEAGEGGEGGGSEPEISAGEDVRRRIIAADAWTRMANFIPNTQGLFGPDGQTKMFDTNAFEQNGASIAAIYENVLEFSEVAAMPLTDEQEAKLEEFRNKLTTTKEEEDLVTDETREVTEQSELVKRYTEYQQKYIDAAMLYNGKRLNALNAEDSAAVQDWALNERLYRQKVEAAYDNWVSAGYKNEVEQMRAYIDQVTRRNLELLKDELLDRIDRTRLTNPNNNARFQWTSVLPAGFAFSEGWTGYDFTHREVERFQSRQTNEFRGGGGLSLGFFNIGGRGGYSETEWSNEVNTDDFHLSCQLTQAMVSRPWFATEFLLSDAWRFGPDMPELDNMTETLSDGERPPEGSMIGYPTAALFVRDVTLRMQESHRLVEEMEREIDAGGAVSIGPLALGGSYSQGEFEREYNYEYDRGALQVPGMQLIGFRCKLLPELPNPNEEIEQWV